MSNFFLPRRSDTRRQRLQTGRGDRFRRFMLIHTGLLTGILSGLLLLLLISPATTYASGGSYINWDSTMIYAGQNNGNPEGPVGEPGAVHGLLYGGANTALDLVLVPGDATLDIHSCDSGQVPLGSVTTDATGQFDFNFKWPTAASSGTYSICALDAGSHIAVINQDGGPYSVLSSSSPTITADTSNIVVGNSITVSGQNWLPPQPITVRIGKCAACDGPNTTLTSVDTVSTGSGGSFSVAVPVPASASPGAYIVDVISKRGNPLDAYFINGPLSLNIQAAPVIPPTAIPTQAVATPTATATPVQTPAVTKTPVTKQPAQHTQAVNTPTNTSSANSDVPGLPVIIAGIAALLLLIVIIVGIFMYLRPARRRQGQPGSGPQPVGYTHYPLPPQSGNFAQAGQVPYGPYMPTPQRIPPQGGIHFQNQPAQTLPPVNTAGQTPPPVSATAQTPPPVNAIAPILPEVSESNPTLRSVSSTQMPIGNCLSCGTPYVAGTQFCGECGKEITNVSANETEVWQP